jgi:hypothetical protein
MHAAGPRVFKPQSLDYRLHARLLPRFLAAANLNCFSGKGGSITATKK